jgi:hypothetical protein
MLPGNSKQLTMRLLVMYMISALLFLTSIDLHIHSRAKTISAGQDIAVHITSVATEINSPDKGDEINISPDGVLKASQYNFSLLAVIILAALIAVLRYFSCVSIRDIQTLFPQLPFHGTPALRAPPVYSS